MTTVPDRHQQTAAEVRTALFAAGQIAVSEMAFDWYCPSDERLPRVNCRPCVAEVVTGAAWPVVAAALAAADRAGYERGRAEVAQRVEAVAAQLDHYVAMRQWAAPGSHDDGINKAQAAIAADLRALAGRKDEKEGQ